MVVIDQTCSVKSAIASLQSNGSDELNFSEPFFPFYETLLITSITYWMSILDFDIAIDYNHTFGTSSNFNRFFLF
jgi:hypothetical protein